MAGFDSKIAIDKPIHEVYHAFLDRQRMKHWLSGFQTIELLHGTNNAVGSRYKLTMLENGHEICLDQEITVNDENQEFAFTMEHETMTSHSRVRFIPLNNHATEVWLTVEIHGKGRLWKFIIPTMVPLIQKRQETDLLKFKTMLESS
ncbi:MAG: SRPBCC family protein [candidate division KSB1 bacterium]|nr:SRPBCC family protein [candidate division KSB1 bacterium]